MVFAELIWILQSPRTYNLNPAEISDLFIPLATIKGLLFPVKKHFPEVIDLFVSTGIDFIDIYNAVMMQSQGLNSVYSYDSGFDLIDDINRLIP